MHTENSNCLHLSPLYEQAESTVAWFDWDEVAEYVLERRFEEEFEQEVTGYSWQDLELYCDTWQELEDYDKTWADLEQDTRLSLGWTWLDLENSDSTWADIEQAGLTWRELHRLAPNLEIYRGSTGDLRPREEGYNWRELNSYSIPWEDFQQMDMTWEEFEAHHGPSTGPLWRDLELFFPDWGYLEEKGLSWEELGNLPSDAIWSLWEHLGFTDNIPYGAKQVTYRLTVRRPDGEDVVVTIPLREIHPRLKGQSPTGFAFPQYLYENWPAPVLWKEQEGADFYILERRFEQGFDEAPQGYNWLDFEQEVGNWQALEDKDYTWRQLEFSTPNRQIYFGKNGTFHEDRKDGRYPGYNDFMPEGTKYVAYRVKSINDLEESGWHTTPLAKVKPRLKGPHPERFAIPEIIYLWEPAPILWKEQIGAIWYRLERSLEVAENGKITKTPYTLVHDSAVTPTTLSAKLKDGAFVGYNDEYPANAISVSYRVMGYNEIEQSRYLTTDYLRIHRNYTRDEMEFTAKNGKPYFVEINARNVETFEHTNMTLQYDGSALNLADFAAQTAKADLAPGKVAGTDLTITAIQSGKVGFSADTAIPGDKHLSGMVTLLRFGGKKDGKTQLNLE